MWGRVSFAVLFIVAAAIALAAIFMAVHPWSVHAMLDMWRSSDPPAINVSVESV
jgi:hypothetical protein